MKHIVRKTIDDEQKAFANFMNDHEANVTSFKSDDEDEIVAEFEAQVQAKYADAVGVVYATLLFYYSGETLVAWLDDEEAEGYIK